MDFAFTEEQDEIRNLARKILDDLATHERLVEIEASEEQLDRALYAELAKSHLLGVCIPEAHGGMGLGYLALCVLLDEIGRAVAPVPVLPSLVLGALPIAEFGDVAQRERWLPRVASGEAILTAGLAEAGNDEPWRPSTVARPDGSQWRLSGTKILVPAAHVADRVLVAARTPDENVAVFLLEPRGESVILRQQNTTDRQPYFELALDEAPVSQEALLGDPGRGGEIVRWIHDRAIVAHCAVQLGVSERALRMTAEYTSSREQFDRPVGSFQAVHMRAGDAFIDVEAMRLTTWQAAWRLAEGLPDEGSVAVAKYWAAEGGQRVGYAAQHLHGGIGIDIDYPLHRYYLWAKQIELTLGSAPVQLSRLGAELAEPLAARA